METSLFECQAKPIAPSVDQIKTWMMLPYAKHFETKSAFLFDHNGDQFTNLYERYIKQPVAVKGDSAGADANDPVFNHDSIRFSGTKLLKIDDSGPELHYTTVFGVVTHLMQIRIRKLAEKTTKKRLFMTLTNDKKLEIYLTFDRRFLFKTGTEVKTTKQFNLINFKWHVVKVVYTKILSASEFFDCSVEIDIFGVGRDGHELNCKLSSSNCVLR